MLSVPPAVQFSPPFGATTEMPSGEADSFQTVKLPELAALRDCGTVDSSVTVTRT
jgi:hypothetical protein